MGGKGTYLYLTHMYHVTDNLARKQKTGENPYGISTKDQQTQIKKALQQNRIAYAQKKPELRSCNARRIQGIKLPVITR